MRLTVIICVWALFPHPICSQVKVENVWYNVEAENLVSNGSFEENYSQWAGSFLKDRNWPILGENPDYFHTDHPEMSYGVPVNQYGYQRPKEGNAYIGLGVILTQSTIRTESIGGMFQSPLVAGDYLIEYYYSFSGNNDYFFPSRIGAGFDFDSTVNYNLVGNLSFLNHAHTTTVYDTLNWQKAQMVLRATGGEQMLVLGCFESYQEMDITILNSSHSDELSSFYYYVDNVSVRRIIDSMYIVEDSFTLFPNPSPNGQFALAYNLPGEVPVTFVLYDAIGKRVAEEILPGGVQHVALNFPSLASGAYVWKALQQGGYVGSGKLVIGR